MAAVVSEHSTERQRGRRAPSPVPRPRRSRGKRWFILGALVAVVVAAAATTVLITWSTEPDTFTAKGTITILDADGVGLPPGYAQDGDQVILLPDGSCAGYGDYADLAIGTAVAIRDANKQVAARGSIIGSRGTIDCRLRFEAAQVPSGQGPYTVHVGNRTSEPTRERELAAGETSITVGTRNSER